jgi:hypothetical protein
MYPRIVGRVEVIPMYTSDKASGAAEMPANIGDGVRRSRRANGKLVTARRSVALSGQHFELLEQPEEIVAVHFPGKLAASLPRPAAPRPAHRPQRRHIALTPTLPQIYTRCRPSLAPGIRRCHRSTHSSFTSGCPRASSTSSMRATSPGKTARTSTRRSSPAGGPGAIQTLDRRQHVMLACRP